MSQLFGPRRRNRRIRNLLLVFGLPAFILVAYFGFIKDNINSNNDDVESQESVEEPTPEVIEEAELIDNSPEGILMGTINGWSRAKTQDNCKTF